MASLFRTTRAASTAAKALHQAPSSAFVRYASSSSSSSSASSSQQPQTPQRQPSSSPSSTSAADVVVRLGSFDFRLSFCLPQLSLPNLLDGAAPRGSEDGLELALLGGHNAPSTAAEQEQEQQGEGDLLTWDGFLNAAPKKKTSHSRKAMRSANKGLKDRVDLVHCQGCGTPKLAHHICLPCYYEIRADQREAIKRAELDKQRRALLAAKAKADAEAKAAIRAIEGPGAESAS